MASEKIFLSFSHYKFMEAICCHSNQSSNPISPKTLCSLSHGLWCFTWNLIKTGRLILEIYYFERVDRCRRRTITIQIPRFSLHLRWAKNLILRQKLTWTFVLGAQKNRLIKTVLLFTWSSLIRKWTFNYTLYPKAWFKNYTNVWTQVRLRPVCHSLFACYLSTADNIWK